MGWATSSLKPGMQRTTTPAVLRARRRTSRLPGHTTRLCEQLKPAASVGESRAALLRTTERRRSFLGDGGRSRQVPSAIARAVEKPAASVGESRAALLRTTERRRSFLGDGGRSRRVPSAIARAVENQLRASGNRAPQDGGGASGGAFPLRATTTPADTPRDCASS